MAAPLLQAQIDIDPRGKGTGGGVRPPPDAAVPSFEREPIDGINASLSRIKAVADR